MHSPRTPFATSNDDDGVADRVDAAVPHRGVASAKQAEVAASSLVSILAYLDALMLVTSPVMEHAARDGDTAAHVFADEVRARWADFETVRGRLGEARRLCETFLSSEVHDLFAEMQALEGAIFSAQMMHVSTAGTPVTSSASGRKDSATKRGPTCEPYGIE